MRSFVEVQPGGQVYGSIRPPGSKSLTNRALIVAALAQGPTSLTGALKSDDTEVMVDSLAKVGASVQVVDDGRTLNIDSGLSPAKSKAEPLQLFVGNSGTTIRFLTAALSAVGGRYRLSGVPRMHQRPIGDLVEALSQLGCDVSTESAGGCPPVVVSSDGWTESRVIVAGSVSSQYLSGLLMAAVKTGKRIEIEIKGELVSRPYVEMTIELMKAFGANVECLGQHAFAVDGTKPYLGRAYEIEPDASAASYHWAAAAITGGSVTVEGLSKKALQGDVAFVDVLAKMGCHIREEDHGITISGRAKHGIDVDMNAISDCVQTLAIVALFAEGTTTIRGVGHNRFKETDRIGDLARELRKLGASVTEMQDGLVIEPPSGDSISNSEVIIETYDDHRMAMSFALAGLKLQGVKIADPACTAKTYPGYFADLERLTGKSHLWSNSHSK